jgi:hypothetical protein
MKKCPQIRSVLIIICVLLAFVILLLVVDSYSKSDYENPLRVAEAFANSLMVKDTENMKSWSCKELHDKIDEVKSSQLLAYISEQGGWHLSSKFNLVCFRRLDDTIVCTYALDNSTFLFNPHNTPLLYTVVLEPCGPISLWERVKEFVYWKVPFGENIFGYSHIKQRWLAIDFHSEDNLEELYAQKIQELEELSQKVKTSVKEKNYKDFNELAEKARDRLHTRLLQLNQWREQEKIEQNSQIRKLYQDFGGIEKETSF